MCIWFRLLWVFAINLRLFTTLQNMHLTHNEAMEGNQIAHLI